jgi:hypothetical protein
MTKFAIPVLALAASTTAAAETSTPTLDPNEVICQTVRVTGSRLGASRRCATRAQWVEEQRQQRAQLAERQQRQVNPQTMGAAERARSFGRSINVGGGSVPN